jgi:hypothetical protein
MRPSSLFWAASLLLTFAPAALAQYKVGDRVKIGSSNEYGTVIEVGAPMYGGGNMIKVHLDRFGDAFPNTGVTYDPVRSKVEAAGVGDPGAKQGGGKGGNPGNPGGNLGGKPGGTGGGNNGGGGNSIANNGGNGDINQGDVQVPDNAPPTEVTFKNLIRAHYPNTLEYKTSVTFTNYSNSGPTNYVDRFAGHLDQENILGGPGHDYKAWKVHAKFTVIEHYGDPLADDVSREYEGDYMCYKGLNGHWIAAGQNVTIAPTRYIHKK